MIIIRLFVIVGLLSSFLLAEERIFFMPNDAKVAEKALIKAFNDAEKTIDIAIYSFTHKKISKALKKAAKRGVKINIITNEKDANKRNRTGYLGKYNNVNAFTLKGNKAKNGKYYGKMHLKVAIIDQKKIVHGSANWSYSAFGLNYETLIIDDTKSTVEKFNGYYKNLLKESKEF